MYPSLTARKKGKKGDLKRKRNKGKKWPRREIRRTTQKPKSHEKEAFLEINPEFATTRGHTAKARSHAAARTITRQFPMGKREKTKLERKKKGKKGKLSRNIVPFLTL